ncbi:MAG: hypothetical protein ACTHJ6_02455, partial [Oryzihumus sp.]
MRSLHAVAEAANLAQRYQQDADMMHDAIRAQVFEGALARTGPWPDGPRVIEAELNGFAERMDADLRHLASVRVSSSVGGRVARVDTLLRSYSAEASRLLALTARDPAAARLALPAFERRFEGLATAQAQLTQALTQAASRAEARADEEESSAVRWTVFVAALTLAAMLLSAFYLARLGGANGRLIVSLRDSRTALASRTTQLEA